MLLTANRHPTVRGSLAPSKRRCVCQSSTAHFCTPGNVIQFLWHWIRFAFLRPFLCQGPVSSCRHSQPVWGRGGGGHRSGPPHQLDVASPGHQRCVRCWVSMVSNALQMKLFNVCIIGFGRKFCVVYIFFAMLFCSAPGYSYLFYHQYFSPPTYFPDELNSKLPYRSWCVWFGKKQFSFDDLLHSPRFFSLLAMCILLPKNTNIISRFISFHQDCLFATFFSLQWNILIVQPAPYNIFVIIMFAH